VVVSFVVVSFLHNSHQDDTKLTSGVVKHDGQDRSEEAKKASQEASRLRERLGKAGVQATKSTAASKSTADSSAPQNVAKQTASAAPAPRAPEAEAKTAESIKGGASNGAPPPVKKSNSVSHAPSRRKPVLRVLRMLRLLAMSLAPPPCPACVPAVCCWAATQTVRGDALKLMPILLLADVQHVWQFEKDESRLRGLTGAGVYSVLAPLVSLLGEWVSFERQLEGVDSRLRRH
jgi:hypothetical protein